MEKVEFEPWRRQGIPATGNTSSTDLKLQLGPAVSTRKENTRKCVLGSDGTKSSML